MLQNWRPAGLLIVSIFREHRNALDQSNLRTFMGLLIVPSFWPSLLFGHPLTQTVNSVGQPSHSSGLYTRKIESLVSACISGIKYV
jgi:hypothetical protein